MTADMLKQPDLLLRDIGELVIVPPGPLPGAKMRDVGLIAKAALLIRDGKISWFGSARDIPILRDVEEVSLDGGVVIPGLIDPHTHIPFAGNRSGEFARRLHGETYLSIMESGGGIRVTTEAVRKASEQQLIDENLPRLARMLALGVTTVECKSGYGLDPDHEVKQLRAIRELDRRQPIDLVPTYLGAHALPKEFDGRPDEFIDHIASERVLRHIAQEGLARFCDVFCDRGAFTVEQARRVLTRAAEAGLRPKIHADELAQIGATKLAGEVGAISADHLEHIDEAGIASMKAAGVIAVVLPGTSFFLGIEHCDARRLIDAELPVALSTDFNPGSSMIESLPLIMNIGACQLRLTPVEIITAVTANAAAAIDVHHRVGAIEPGYEADLTVLDVPTLADWFYTPGRPQVKLVIKRGERVAGADAPPAPAPGCSVR